MKNLLLALCLLLTMGYAGAECRTVRLLDKGWKFIFEDIHGAAEVSFDDSGWETVTVPHDGAISGPFDMNHDAQIVMVKEDGETSAHLRTGRTGALPFIGAGWYRLELSAPEIGEGKRVFLEFDGVMSMPEVYLNGESVGKWMYGYTSFGIDVTSAFRYGEKNILAVRFENLPSATRWYPGAGIYRNVRLVATDNLHIPQYGVRITTPVIEKGKGIVEIGTAMSGVSGSVRLQTQILDSAGQVVASDAAVVKGNDSAFIKQRITVKQPSLWQVGKPYMYTVVSRLYSGKELKDEYRSSFGFRTIVFEKDKGMFINGNPVKMKGVCLHHDLGPLGAAVNYRAIQRQLEILQEMGCNAIRTSHNPPAPELLELCDKMGFMAIVEAFDEFSRRKCLNGYHIWFDEWAEKDLRTLIRRDANHPSVVLWSIGNEVAEQQIKGGADVARFLVGICHDEDPSRLVTAGVSNMGAMKNGFAEELDVVGFNYKHYAYKNVHQQHPDMLLFGSETASTVSSRGIYKFPVKEFRNVHYQDYHVSSYDMEFPGWASVPDKEFEQQDDCAYLCGEFVWTGFDYLGEPTPFNEGTPAKSSYFGIVDLAGLKKDRFYLYQSRWNEKEKVLHVLPHWTWPDREGKNVPVFCYTSYPKAELFVNGKSMGIREKSKEDKFTRNRLMWNDVIYQPGNIRVVAYDSSGKAVAEKQVETAAEASVIHLAADRKTIAADGKDLSFVTVELKDEKGNLDPRASNLLFFKVNGPGKLKAVCNGDPTDQTSFGSNYMKAFNGKLVVVLESSETAGEIELIVSGYRLKSGAVVIKSE